mmetsp:Transcript_9694/g.23849  ORF Transcript_9694/g.23849 Transcript_9694/m.23849 type:complete len:84 (+) Transcript_9694:271-522(+)
MHVLLVIQKTHTHFGFQLKIQCHQHLHKAAYCNALLFTCQRNPILQFEFLGQDSGYAKVYVLTHKFYVPSQRLSFMNVCVLAI